MADPITYCCPDFSKCGPGAADIGPGIQLGLEGLGGIFDFTEDGSKEWAVPFFAFWSDIPMCLWSTCCYGTMCIEPRNVAGMTGKSCEGQWLAACFAQCVCLGTCFKGRVRTNYRKKYNLKGSAGMDFWLTVCFAWCLMCQEAIQLGVDTGYKVPFTQVGMGAATKAPTTQVMVK